MPAEQERRGALELRLPVALESDEHHDGGGNAPGPRRQGRGAGEPAGEREGREGRCEQCRGGRAPPPGVSLGRGAGVEGGSTDQHQDGDGHHCERDEPDPPGRRGGRHVGRRAFLLDPGGNSGGWWQAFPLSRYSGGGQGWGLRSEEMKARHLALPARKPPP